MLSLILLALAGAVTWILPTFTNQGREAITKMSDEERTMQVKLDGITAAMTYADIEAILGPPDRPAGGLRPTWQFPKGGGMSQIAVYFSDGHPRKIRWMKLGSFTWEKSL